jgi:HPt (histidine-containing phosphotransfer) domain-containing protein
LWLAAIILGMAAMTRDGAGSGALDLELLARQTLGDRELEADLLELFELQALRLWPVIAGAGEAASRSDAAHTLKGGAAAVGATEVMRIAGELEVALGREGKASAALLSSLDRALQATCSAIAAWRRMG